MNLVIRGITLNDNVLSQPLIGRFDERGGSVGRSDNATMTLPDPERLISRVQANVSFGANTYWLEDVGSANPVVHNGLPLGPGVKVPLKPNDELRIGGYRLAVEYEAAENSATVVRGRPMSAPAPAPASAREPEPAPAVAEARAPAGKRPNPFLDVLRGGGRGTESNGQSDDPFSLFLKKPDAQAPGGLPAAPGTRGAVKPGEVFDPFAPFEQQAASDRGVSPDRAPPGTVQPSISLEGMRSRRAPSSRGAPPPVDDADAPPKVPQHLVRDFDDALKAAGNAVGTPPARPKSSSRKVATNSGSSRRAAPAPAAPAEPGQPSAYTADEIWQGFLDGAGVDLTLPRGVTPDMMRTIGLMLRLSVEGMLDLIAVRAAAKNELHAPVTVIQVRENNPMKFSPDAGAALLQLLQPPGRGFLPGPEAIRDAMVDLQSHQIGTMAGMRAALAGVLERFQPELLEGRLNGQSMLDALLPMNRKAKLWELFLQHYRTIRTDAEEDFHALFGKAFVEAYNAQVERLAQKHAHDDDAAGQR